MRRSLVLFTALLLVVAAGQASAKTLSWHGTLDMDLGALQTLRARGSGVAAAGAWSLSFGSSAERVILSQSLASFLMSVFLFNVV